MKLVEITVTAQLPDDNEELGHEAVVATKAVTHAVVAELEKLNLYHVRSHRRIVTKRDPAPVETAPAPASATAPAPTK